jgi:hypothetical protein
VSLTAQQHLSNDTASRAISSTLFGRYMLPDMSEYPCQVSDISVSGATFITSHVPPGGQPVVAYLEELGRVEAVTGEPVPGGFRVAFALKGSRLERLESRLRWLSEKNAGTGEENRRHARFEPRDSRSSITLPDGRVYTCEVLDISLSGAAIKVEVLPSLGTYVMLGKMRGRIVRYIDAGVAIEFVKPLDRAQLQEQIK